MTNNPHSAQILRASWIWKLKPTPDQYVCFRRKFSSDEEIPNAVLDVSVDTDFVAYLNEEEIGRGQFGDLAHAKTWNRYTGATVRAGENVLAILAFYKGEDFFDYQTGTAGLLLRLEAGEIEVLSDAEWSVTAHPAFQNGRKLRVTNQMGFTFDFDARARINWRALDFDDSGWESARVIQAGGKGSIYRELTPRPLPALEILDPVSPRVAAQGSFVHLRRSALTAENMAGAALAFEFPSQVFSNPELDNLFSAVSDDNPAGKVEQYAGPPQNAGAFLTGNTTPLALRATPDGADGRYLILDLREETVGLLEFDIEASSGTVLEIASGEHLDDGRVRSTVGGRNFADRYVCSEGRQSFQMPFRRIAARYLQVHVSDCRTLKIHRFGLRQVEYPTERRGSFVTGDRFSRRLHETSIRSLELCRHDHFEDCPWREQALYAYDSRLQALFGYYAFGDYEFPKVGFELLGNSADENGYVALTAPGKSEINIPIFSFAWVVAIAEHALFSGDTSLFTTSRGAIEKILLGSLTRRDGVTGLYLPPEGMEFWQFYEWTPGLAGGIGQASPRGQLDAAYNLFLREALRAYLRVAPDPAPEIEPAANALGERIHECFWNEEAGHYFSELSSDGSRSGCHEFVQALAICEEIVPTQHLSRVMDALTSGRATRCSFSSSFYLLKAALLGAPEDRSAITDRLHEIWETILFSGATSMWETEHGAIDFDFAGSLCHGWTALPVWFHQAAVLGIIPTSPGFATFDVAVYPASHRQASGKIPTPHGEIQVDWILTPQGLEVTVSGPNVCRPTFKSFDEYPIAAASYNGTPISNSSGCANSWGSQPADLPNCEGNETRLTAQFSTST